MKHPEILNHEDLAKRITQLNSYKDKIENDLGESCSELLKSLNPVTLTKNTLHELVHDDEVQSDLTQVGLGLGANFIIDRVLGRDKSVKGFLSSILVEKIAGNIISKNSEKITSLIGSFFKSKPSEQAQT